MACHITIRWRAPLGIGVYLARATGDEMTPGVLLLVTWWCVCGVVLRKRLFVGLCDSIIPGAFVICGMVMGASSITLCSASLICWWILFTTLWLFCVNRGASIAMMPSWSMHKSCFPLVFLFALAAPLVSSLVRACKCWWGDRDVSSGWQCWRNSSVEPNMRYPWVSGM